MKFPIFSIKKSSPPDSAGELERVEASTAPEKSAGSAWSTGLLMIGSALVGATAVAVWNRRTITEMRTHLELNSGESRQVTSGDAANPDDIF
jgi:hypothetical protein